MVKNDLNLWHAVLPALALISAPFLAKADAIDICRSANPQFPQLCGCAVTRGQEAGFGDAVLERLLAHDYSGVSVEDTQRFGLIFVECTHAAIMEGAVAGAAPLPLPHQTGTAPAVATTLPLAPEPDALAAPDPNPAPGASVAAATNRGYTITFPQGRPEAPGVWTRFATLTKPMPDGEWRPQIAPNAYVEDDVGGFFFAGCNMRQVQSFVLGQIAPDLRAEALQITVRGRSGILFEQFVTPERIEGDLLAFAVGRGDLNGALRRGNEVEIRAGYWFGGNKLETTKAWRFGLKGSSRALEFSQCSNTRVSPAAGFFNETVSGTWSVGDADLESGLFVPALQLGYGGPMENLTLLCDRRLRVSPLEKYIAPAGFETALSYRYSLKVDAVAETEVAFVFPGERLVAATTETPLPAPFLEAMANGGTLWLAPLDMEPGDGTYRGFDLAGFSDGLSDMECPDIPQLGATARTDLTGQGLTWSGGDIGDALPRRADGSPVKTPVAFLDIGTATVPPLSMYCEGVPFFFGGDFPVRSGFDLRMVVDGNEATAEIVNYGSYRAFLNGFPSDAMQSAILRGTTLRITLMANPEIDILYPLLGMKEVLTAAGCP